MLWVRSISAKLNIGLLRAKSYKRAPFFIKNSKFLVETSYSDFFVNFRSHTSSDFNNIDVNFSNHVCKIVLFPMVCLLDLTLFFCSTFEALQIKSKKASLFNLNHSQKHSQSPAQCPTARSNFQIVANCALKYQIITKTVWFWINTEFHLFFYLKFILFRLFLTFFLTAKAGIVLNLFLNFWKKWTSFSYEIVLIWKKV